MTQFLTNWGPHILAFISGWVFAVGMWFSKHPEDFIILEETDETEFVFEDNYEA